MEYLYERVAYLRGLCEGLGIVEETKEGKVLAEIVELLGEFADSIVELSDRTEDLEIYTEAMDDDISDLEDELFAEDDEDDDDYEPIGFIQMKCPSCGEEVEIDEDLLYDEESDILCPSCGEIVIGAIGDDDFEDTDIDL